MMTLRKKQIFRCGFLAVIAFCLASVLTFLSADKSVAYAGTASFVETVYVGDVIKADEHKIEGVSAEGVIATFPSGGVYGGESISLSQAGKYRITYYANVNGERVEEVKQYLAIRRPKDVMIVEDGMNVAFGDYQIESPYELKKGINGTVVDFKSGQSVTFTTRIKTEKLTKDYDILEMIVMPSVFGETDFERLTVVVTDANDASNYVEILIDSSNTVDGAGMVSYVRAGAPGQTYGGYEGKTYHTANYGTSVEHSFRGTACINGNRNNKTVSENLLTVAIDNSQKIVYCGPYSATSTEKLLVNDLDDPLHYKSNPWSGFTSDEVVVKVTAGKFVKGQGKVVFTNVGDYDLTKDIFDSAAPEISVEYDSTLVPVAEVGKEFPLFAFSAKDGLDDSVKSNVWVYHVSSSGKRVTVNHDGEKFLAAYSGKYEIVYHAEDYSGNAAESKIVINAVEKAPEITADIGEALIESEVYGEVNLTLPSQLSVSGGSGALSVEREVLSPSGEKLDVKERLVLTELGDYKAVYVVTDYLGNKASFTKTVRVSAIAAPKFVEEPSFESALIKGFTYELPSAMAVETLNGEVKELAVKVYVNGVLVENSFVADGAQATVAYVAEGQTGTAEWTKTFAIVDTENGKYKSRYFYTEGNLSVADEENYLRFTVKGDGRAEFLNALSSTSFVAQLRFDASAINFNAMRFIMTDAQNKALSVTYTFRYDAAQKSWFMQLKDGQTTSFFTSKDIFTFMYMSSNGKIVDASGEQIVTIKSYDNGDVFNGFSNMVYFAIEFEGVAGDSAIGVEKLCNQMLGYGLSGFDFAKDDMKPVIELNDTFVTRQSLGAKANIPTARAFDVLSQVESVTVVVEGVNGETLYSGSALQAIDITLSKAGYYVVTYKAKDTLGNTAKITYGISVNDEVKPVLTVNNNLKSEYKVGDKIAVPGYTVTDNDGAYFVQVMLLMPNNEMRLLIYDKSGSVTSLLDKENPVYDNDFKTDNGEFVVTDAGRYVLRIIAYDEYYNYVVEEIVFNVK